MEHDWPRSSDRSEPRSYLGEPSSEGDSPAVFGQHAQVLEHQWKATSTHLMRGDRVLNEPADLLAGKLATTGRSTPSVILREGEKRRRSAPIARIFEGELKFTKAASSDADDQEDPEGQYDTYNS